MSGVLDRPGSKDGLLMRLHWTRVYAARVGGTMPLDAAGATIGSGSVLS